LFYEWLFGAENFFGAFEKRPPPPFRKATKIARLQSRVFSLPDLTLADCVKIAPEFKNYLQFDVRSVCGLTWKRHFKYN